MKIKFILKLFGLMAMMLGGIMLTAEESGGNFGPNHGGGGRGGFGPNRNGGRGFGGNRGQMRMPDMLRRFRAELELKKQYPEQYAEALRQLLAAETALQDLAKRAKIDVPLSLESQLRLLQAKCPEDFAALLEKKQSFPEEMQALQELAKKNDVTLNLPMFGQRNGLGGEAAPENPAPSRRSGEVNLAALRRRFPEEVKALEAIRGSDPEKFRQGIIELHRKTQKAD